VLDSISNVVLTNITNLSVGVSEIKLKIKAILRILSMTLKSLKKKYKKIKEMAKMQQRMMMIPKIKKSNPMRVFLPT